MRTFGHGFRSSPLSVVPVTGCCLPARANTRRSPTLPLRGLSAHVSITVPAQSARSRHPGQNYGYGLEWQWHPRYGAGAGHQPTNGHGGAKKKIEAVNQRPPVRPGYAPDPASGLRLCADEMWSFVRSKKAVQKRPALALVGRRSGDGPGVGLRFRAAHPRHVPALVGRAGGGQLGGQLGGRAVADRCLGSLRSLFARRPTPNWQGPLAALGTQALDLANAAQTADAQNNLLFEKAVLSRRTHHPLYFSFLLLTLYNFNTPPFMFMCKLVPL